MNKKIKKAVIPCAGYGTRFLPLTKVVPKELIPIGHKPAIQCVVEEAVLAGIEEIIFVCHPDRLAVRDYFIPDSRLNSFLEENGKHQELSDLRKIEHLAKFTVVYQKKPLGLGHAILCAESAVGDESFIVLLPDVLVVGKIPASQQLVRAYLDHKEWGVLLEKVPQSKISSYGIVKILNVPFINNGIWWLEGALEKPTLAEAPSDLAILGRCIFTPDIFRVLCEARPGVTGEIQLTDAINTLCKHKPGFGILYDGKTLDIGTPQGFSEAKAFLSLQCQP